MNVRISSSMVKKAESKPVLPSALPIASNSPFVNLEPPDSMKKKLLASTMTLQESMVPSLKRSSVLSGAYGSLGGFLELLQQSTYYDIQNDLCDILRLFMERKERIAVNR